MNQDLVGATSLASLGAKERANYTARGCMAGVVLSWTTDDRGRDVVIASKWAMTRQVETVEALESFLRRIGGAAA